MAELEQGLEELKVVKQAFKDNISANNVSTSNVEFRNMPDLLKQMEKKLPNQTKSVEPTKYPQIVKADEGYKLEAVGVREIPSQYIIPTGTKEITENNEYDVTQYSKVKVEVANAGTGTGGNPKFSQLIDGTIESLEESDLSEPNRIKDYTFYYCTSLTSAVIPSNITSIGASAFEGCYGLQTLVMSDGVQSIGASAFKGINASAINIPSTISVLETEVFANNTALTSITIPSNIAEIKDNAFYGCTNLTEITMENTTPIAVTENTFPANVTSIYVKYSAYDAYIANWSAYADKIVRLSAIPSTITVIADNYLGGKVSGASVTITGNDLTFTGTTDEQGVFTQGDLQPATYTVSLSDMEGYQTPSTQEVSVLENTENSIEFVYLEKPSFPSFSEADFDTISQVSSEISSKNMTSEEIYATYGWKAGDEKVVTFTDGEIVPFRIIGFNHDISDSTSQKVGITIQTVNCISTTSVYNLYSNTNSGGYAVSQMAETLLNIYRNLLPVDLTKVIKKVKKKFVNGGGNNYKNILESGFNLFLLSETEVLGKVVESQYGQHEGSIYEYYVDKTSNDRIKYIDSDGDNIVDKIQDWGLRSCYITTLGFVKISSYNGNSTLTYANTATGISFALCI